MTTWLGLSLALVSAIVVNWGYAREHDAAARLPRLSPRRPLRSVRLLTHDRRWLRGFALETGGWLIYVAALRLAPLALVQAVGAAGIAVLAVLGAHGHPLRLGLRKQLGVAVGLAGLALLALSLLGHAPSERLPRPLPAAAWLGACAAAGFALIAVRGPIARAATLGLAAGLLFAGGDISVKLVVHGGWWLVALGSLIAFYASGSIRLQAAFQHGDPLTAAGMATLATNALPISAGFVLFGESLPSGTRAILQIVGLAATVASALALAEIGRTAPARAHRAARSTG